MTNVILVKYAEIALKGRNRDMFEKRLAANIRAVLPEGVSVARESGRLRIEGVTGHLQQLRDRLATIFGIHAFVPAFWLDTSCGDQELNDTIRQAVEPYAEQVATFAVDVRRSVKRGARSSQELNRDLGQVINDAYPGLSVDLDRPALTVFVELREGGTYVYTSRDEGEGLGGMPVGSAGSGLAIMSGGIDSPIACWLAMKRGMAMDVVYFHSHPYTGEKAREKVIDLTRVLARYANGPITVYTPSLAGIQQRIAERAAEGYWTVLFRRSMQRIAERITDRYGYALTVTGDSVAQVASQTPENLAAIDAASGGLTIRPLIGYDKREIIDRAKQIGTYEISTRPYEDCCSVFTPGAPKTKIRQAAVAAQEERCEIAELEDAAVRDMSAFSVTPRAVTELTL